MVGALAVPVANEREPLAHLGFGVVRLAGVVVPIRGHPHVFAEPVERVRREIPAAPARLHVAGRLERLPFLVAVDQRLALVRPHHAGVEQNVGVEEFARERVGPARPDGVRHFRRDPPERGVGHVFRVELFALLLAHLDGVAEADLLEGFVPFENPLADGRPVLFGHGVFDPVDDLLFRRHELGTGFPRGAVGALQPPVVDVPHERGVGRLLREVFEDGGEVADAVVRVPGLVARFREFDDAVVDHHGGPPGIDHGIAAGRGHAVGAVPGECRGDFQFDVLFEGFDFVPRRPLAVEEADVDVAQVAEEDLVEVDQHRPLHGVEGFNRQRHQHRIGVGGFERPCGRGTRSRRVPHVATHHEHFVADLAEQQHILVAAVERGAPDPGALGDRHRHEERLVELERQDLGVDVVVFLVEREEAVVNLGPFHDGGEVRELLFRGIRGRAFALPAGNRQQCHQSGDEQHIERGTLHGRPL